MTLRRLGPFRAEARALPQFRRPIHLDIGNASPLGNFPTSTSIWIMGGANGRRVMFEYS